MTKGLTTMCTIKRRLEPISSSKVKKVKTFNTITPKNEELFGDNFKSNLEIRYSTLPEHVPNATDEIVDRTVRFTWLNRSIDRIAFKLLRNNANSMEQYTCSKVYNLTARDVSRIATGPGWYLVKQVNPSDGPVDSSGNTWWANQEFVYCADINTSCWLAAHKYDGSVWSNELCELKPSSIFTTGTSPLYKYYTKGEIIEERLENNVASSKHYELDLCGVNTFAYTVSDTQTAYRRCTNDVGYTNDMLTPMLPPELSTPHYIPVAWNVTSAIEVLNSYSTEYEPTNVEVEVKTLNIYFTFDPLVVDNLPEGHINYFNEGICLLGDAGPLVWDWYTAQLDGSGNIIMNPDGPLLQLRDNVHHCTNPTPPLLFNTGAYVMGPVNNMGIYGGGTDKWYKMDDY